MQVTLPQPTTPTAGFQKGDRRGAEDRKLDPPIFPTKMALRVGT